MCALIAYVIDRTSASNSLKSGLHATRFFSPQTCLSHAPARVAEPTQDLPGERGPRWGLLFHRAPFPFSPVRNLCPCQLMASPALRGDSRKDPASATLGADAGSHFVSLHTRSIMGIHLGTRLRKSGGSGGCFFRRMSRLFGSSAPAHQTSRAFPAASAGKSGAHPKTSPPLRSLS